MRPFWLLAALFTLSGLGQCDEPAAGPATGARLPVLLLSGQNNHDWRETTPRIKAILEATGRFQVDVHERPHQLTSALLRPYAAIISNWNSFGHSGSEQGTWSAEVRQAYLQFVRGGKGHVVIHAGSSSFGDWPEYQQLTLAWWQSGQTRHGPQQTFTVQVEPATHPITRGLVDFETHDELWRRPGWTASATVLASVLAAADEGGPESREPVALVDSFGQGRSFTLLLGHDATAMQNPGFQSLLARGVEWAATGEVADPHPSRSRRSAQETLR